MEFKITLFQSKNLGTNYGILLESEFGDVEVIEDKYDWNVFSKLNMQIKKIIANTSDKPIYLNIDIEK